MQSGVNRDNVGVDNIRSIRLKGLPWRSVLIAIGTVIIFFLIFAFIFVLPPSKSNIDNFFSYNACAPKLNETDAGSEYPCAAYLRRHSTLVLGGVYSVPTYTFLFFNTPFHYFNYIDEKSKSHTYVFIKTGDYGMVVYNPVNGEYIGKMEELRA